MLELDGGLTLDCLQVQGIRGYGYTGLLPEEQSLGQWFEVSLQLYLDVQVAGQSDRLEDTLDYHALILQIQTLLQRSRFALIERLATVIAEAVLAHPKVQQVKVSLIKKPSIPDFAGQVQVDIVRSRDNGKPGTGVKEGTGTVGHSSLLC